MLASPSLSAITSLRLMFLLYRSLSKAAARRVTIANATQLTTTRNGSTVDLLPDYGPDVPFRARARRAETTLEVRYMPLLAARTRTHVRGAAGSRPVSGLATTDLRYSAAMASVARKSCTRAALDRPRPPVVLSRSNPRTVTVP